MTDHYQQNPAPVIEAHVSSVNHNTGGLDGMYAAIEAARRAKEKRDAAMVKRVKLPKLSEETGTDFFVTLKRMSQSELAMTGEVSEPVRAYIDLLLLEMNSAGLEYARSGDELEGEELEQRNRNIGVDAFKTLLEQYGGIENERMRREVADAYCLLAVTNPMIVEDELDIDPSLGIPQMPLSLIPEEDRQVIQNEAQTAEEQAIAADLKSVSSEDAEPTDTGTAKTDTPDVEAAIDDPEASGGATHASVDPGTDSTPELSESV